MPTLPPMVMVGMMAASAAMATAGTVISAVQQSNTAKANQNMANQQAEIAQQQSRIQQEQIARKGALVQGQQGAAGAASGIDSASGSLLDVESDSGTQMQYDKLKAKYNGDLQAWNYRTQAAQFGQQASNSLVAGGINTASSLIGGGMKTWNSGVDSGEWKGPKFSGV